VASSRRSEPDELARWDHAAWLQKRLGEARQRIAELEQAISECDGPCRYALLNKETVTKAPDLSITKHEDQGDIHNRGTRVVADHGSPSARQARSRYSRGMSRLAETLRRIRGRQSLARVGGDGGSHREGGDRSNLNPWLEILRGVAPGQYSERAIRERRLAAKVCICPSHASNRGECVIHDEYGRVRFPLPVLKSPHTERP
jgi:hypothetical protein